MAVLYVLGLLHLSLFGFRNHLDQGSLMPTKSTAPAIVTKKVSTEDYDTLALLASIVVDDHIVHYTGSCTANHGTTLSLDVLRCPIVSLWNFWRSPSTSSGYGG